MSVLRRVLHVVGFFIAAGIVYVFYGFVTAEDRIKEVCSQIKPGMPASELRVFAGKHGLGPHPPSESGVNFLVESKTFGRYGCKVELVDGIVKDVEYNFSN